MLRTPSLKAHAFTNRGEMGITTKKSGKSKLMNSKKNQPGWHATKRTPAIKASKIIDPRLHLRPGGPRAPRVSRASPAPPWAAASFQTSSSAGALSIICVCWVPCVCRVCVCVRVPCVPRVCRVCVPRKGGLKCCCQSNQTHIRSPTATYHVVEVAVAVADAQGKEREAARP